MPVNFLPHPHLNPERCFHLSRSPSPSQPEQTTTWSSLKAIVVSWFTRQDSWLVELSQQLAAATYPERQADYYQHLSRHIRYSKTKSALAGLEAGLKLIHQAWPTFANPQGVAEKLVEEINQCTDGHFDRVNTVLLGLERNLPDSIHAFLEKVRKNIVEKLANSSTGEVHTHNHFFTLAFQEGYGVHPLHADDFYLGDGTYSDDEIKEKLQDTFREEYSPGAILPKLFEEFKSALIVLGYCGRKESGFYPPEQMSFFMEYFKRIFPERLVVDFFITDDNSCVIDIDWVALQKTWVLLLTTEGYLKLPQDILDCFLDLTIEDPKAIKPVGKQVDLSFLFSNGFVSGPSNELSFAEFILPLCTPEQRFKLLKSLIKLDVTRVVPLIETYCKERQAELLDMIFEFKSEKLETLEGAKSILHLCSEERQLQLLQPLIRSDLLRLIPLIQRCSTEIQVTLFDLLIQSSLSMNEVAVILPACSSEQRFELIKIHSGISLHSLIDLIKLCPQEEHARLLALHMEAQINHDDSFYRFIQNITSHFTHPVLIQLSIFYVNQIRPKGQKWNWDFFKEHIQLLAHDTSIFYELIWAYCKHYHDSYGLNPKRLMDCPQEFFRVFTLPQRKAFVLYLLENKRLDCLAISELSSIGLSYTDVLEIIQGWPQEKQTAILIESFRGKGPSLQKMMMGLPKASQMSFLDILFANSAETQAVLFQGRSPSQWAKQWNVSSDARSALDLKERLALREIDFWLKKLEALQHQFSCPLKQQACRELYNSLDTLLKKKEDYTPQQWAKEWEQAIKQCPLRKEGRVAHILKNILLCLSVIGGLVVLGKIIYDHTHEKGQYGFFPSKIRKTLHEVKKLPVMFM